MVTIYLKPANNFQTLWYIASEKYFFSILDAGAPRVELGLSNFNIKTGVVQNAENVWIAYVCFMLLFHNSRPTPNSIELLSTKICLAWHFFLDKNRVTIPIFICWILLVTGIQLLFAYPENHVEIWLVIRCFFPFRGRHFHAKQIFVLSSSMKLGPSLLPQTSSSGSR